MAQVVAGLTSLRELTVSSSPFDIEACGLQNLTCLTKLDICDGGGAERGAVSDLPCKLGGSNKALLA
ncbi:hypothetical protein WJX73_009627 [Symbiochloris irregularis]|uniref:Uncharacterized protein n=1 Tax=Symbiochloris irregularis TaxID=706552 RepID=A0AAW1NWB8_9CHLO